MIGYASLEVLSLWLCGEKGEYFGLTHSHIAFFEPYKVIYVIMHFVGAITALNVIWGLGDLVLAFVTIPNVLALVLLSGTIKKLTDRYFEKMGK